MRYWISKCKIIIDNETYQKYCAEKARCDIDIDKDITRTFIQSHEFCANSDNYNKLWRILHCFAIRNKRIGYIQGLNFLAGNLLLAFPETVNLCTNIVCVLGLRRSLCGAEIESGMDERNALTQAALVPIRAFNANLCT